MIHRGNGYRLLRDGENKQAGDEWRYVTGHDTDWHPVVEVGSTFRDVGERLVRRVTTNEGGAA